MEIANTVVIEVLGTKRVVFWDVVPVVWWGYTNISEDCAVPHLQVLRVSRESNKMKRS
jgi:hypothetical protein